MSTVPHVEPRRGGSFPVLLEVGEEQSLVLKGTKPFPDGHPSDVYLGRYWAGATTDQDRIELVRPISTTSANEMKPLWAPGGTFAFISDWTGKRCLYQQVASDPPRRVVESSDIIMARYSPDGQVLAYVAWGPGFRRELWHVGPGDASPRRINTRGGEPCDVEFLPDNKSVVCHMSGGECGDGLFEVGLLKPDLKRLVGGNAHEPAVSPDGNTLVYLKNSFSPKLHVDLWSFDRRTGRETRLAAAEPGAQQLFQPTFSPDGSRVIVTGSYTTGGLFAATTWVMSPSAGDVALRQVRVANRNVLAVVPQRAGTIARSHAPPRRKET